MEGIEDWFKKKLNVPDNWDKFDYEMQRYSFNDMVDFGEQLYYELIIGNG